MKNIPTSDQLEAQFANLPTDIQEAISSTNTSKIMLEIGKKNRLHIDQMQELSAITGYLMMGFIKPQDFVDELTNEARIPQSLAVLIAKDVNTMVLNPIKDRLKEAHENLTNKPKTVDVGQGAVGIFEQKVKHLFPNDNTTAHTTPRSTIKPPGSADPYRETFDE